MRDKLDIIRNQIVDIALIFASALGAVTYIVSLHKLFNSPFQISFITDLLAVLAIIAITIYRKRISVLVKGSVILLGLFLVTFIDILQLGLLSANKIFIVLIPFFGLTIFSFKKTVYIFITAIFLFFLLGFLIISDNNPMLTEGENHITDINAWVINGLILIITTVVTLVITNKFNQTYLSLINKITLKNKKLSQSERNYKEIFNGSTDAIFIHAMDGSVINVNKSMLTMYGYSDDEIKAVPFKDFCSGISPYDTETADIYIDKAIREGKQIFDWQARKKNGDLFWVEVALKKITIGEHERILAIVRDINDKKELSIQLENYKNKLELLVKKRTEELNRTNKDLKIANEQLLNQKEELTITLEKLKKTQEQLIQQEKMASLGVLTTGIGHEINNPLNFIQTGIYSIDTFFEDYNSCEDICKHKDELKMIADRMQVGVDRVINIVNGLNHFSRQSTKYNEKCNIHKTIDNCLVILNNQYKHRIEVIKEYSEANPLISGNSGKLHQAFINILINAIHAIKEKGRINIMTKIENNHFNILIIDSGEGISKENVNKIFDPFFTTKEAGEGTGLGLSITYGIIKDHKGKLIYESEENKGTKVQIQLPYN